MIKDQFTTLPITRQRKHQLRNPEFRKELFKRYYFSNREFRLEQRKQNRIRNLLGDLKPNAGKTI